jgi:hypothetical protein
MTDVDQQDPTPTSTPTTAPAAAPPPGGGRRRAWLVVAVIAVVALAVVGVLALTGGEDDEVRTGDRASDDPVAGGDAAAATVAVTYGDGSAFGEPAGLTLTFVGPDGATVAERAWSEVEEGAAGVPADQVTAMRGLVQDVPAGDLTLVATIGDATCEQAFTAAAGDRLVLRAQPSALGVETDPMDAPVGAGGASSGAVGEPVDPEACATVETVEQWVAGRTGPTGEDYVGLSLADAEARATAAGLTTRVLGVDGMDLVATSDFREDRLNLSTFDGVVVAAALDGEGQFG